MSIWLDPDEVHQLTDRMRWKAQCKALQKMGVPFRPNAVGRPLVPRDAVLSQRKTRTREPNWDARYAPRSED